MKNKFIKSACLLGKSSMGNINKSYVMQFDRKKKYKCVRFYIGLKKHESTERTLLDKILSHSYDPKYKIDYSVPNGEMVKNFRL